MEKSLSGFRDNFYRELLCEYKDEGVDSFLYQYFWTESVAELLEKCSLGISGPVRPEEEADIRARLRKAVKERPDLLPLKGNQELDFWEELWLNTAGRQAGLISDTDCCLWLVNRLAEQGKYYKDTSLWDGRDWLLPLLRAGLGERALEPGCRVLKSGKHKGRKIFSMAQFGRDLKELAEEMERDREKIKDRLSNLKEGYLPWLTGRLEQMALHIKIKDWLQYSGYPLVKDESKKREKRSEKRPQKQDSTMRLLEAYFDSRRGGLFRGAEGGGTAVKGWRLDSGGYCIMEMDKIEALKKALEQSEETCFYIPLAVDPRSGCVFFLAGKEIYAKVYQVREDKWKKVCVREAEACSRAKENYLHRKKYFDNKEDLEQIYYTAEKNYKNAERIYTAAVEARKAYEASPVRCCFDFLRLDKPYLNQFLGNPAGSFRLMPAFHKNAGESCQSILGEFKRYCEARSERYLYSPPNAIKEFNQEPPAGIPEEFIWAFGDPEGEEPVRVELSREAINSFRDSQAKPLQAPSSPSQQFGK